MVIFNRSRFDLALQYYLTDVAGDYVQHYKSMPCSCSVDSAKALPHCRVCFGTGRAYLAPRQVHCLLTMATQHKDLMNTGAVLAGDLVLSPNVHDVDWTYGDVVRIEYDKGASWSGEVLERVSNVQRLTYPPKEVLNVIKFDPNTGDQIVYTEGTDFTVSGRSLTWMAGPLPAIGARVSIRYTAEFEWVVIPPPSPRFERGTPLGMRIVVRLRHLVVAGRDTGGG